MREEMIPYYVIAGSILLVAGIAGWRLCKELVKPESKASLSDNTIMDKPYVDTLAEITVAEAHSRPAQKKGQLRLVEKAL